MVVYDGVALGDPLVQDVKALKWVRDVAITGF